jgi:hypothetical protein
MKSIRFHLLHPMIFVPAVLPSPFFQPTGAFAKSKSKLAEAPFGWKKGEDGTAGAKIIGCSSCSQVKTN